MKYDLTTNKLKADQANPTSWFYMPKKGTVTVHIYT